MQYKKENYLIRRIYQENGDEVAELLGTYPTEEAKKILKGKKILKHFSSPFDWNTEVVFIQG